jgi:heme-degrading monooxygenase HmoA
MVMTILEGHVAPEKADALERAYREALNESDPGLVQTFLLHSSADSTLWRIATVWSSREALAEMRKLGTPRGVLIFRAAGAEATLSVFDIVSTITIA